MNKTLIISASLAVAIHASLGAAPAWADDQSAVLGDLRIEEVAATPAKAGGLSRITFTIENDGSERAIVTGLKLPTGEPSRVLGFLGTSHNAPIGGLPIAPGELYRLDGRTAWIDVGPLKADLTAGSVIPATLVLDRFQAPITIHVVGTPGSGRPSETTGSVRPAR